MDNDRPIAAPELDRAAILYQEQLNDLTASFDARDSNECIQETKRDKGNNESRRLGNREQFASLSRSYEYRRHRPRVKTLSHANLDSSDSLHRCTQTACRRARA